MGRGHAHVDDRQVGLVALDDGEQVVGVVDGGDHLLPGVGQQPREAGAQEHGVLGDHDPHGSSTSSVVGPPGGLTTCMLPPWAITRSRSPRRPVPASGSAPPATVVAHLDDQPVAGPRDRDRRGRGLGVAGDVGERLGDHEVGGALDRRRRPLGHVDVEAHRHRRAGHDGGEGGVEAPVLEDHGMDAADQVADLLQRGLRLLVGLGHQRAPALGVDLEPLAGVAQVHGQGDQPLLGAIVQVALDAPPLGLGAVHGRRPAGLELRHATVDRLLGGPGSTAGGPRRCRSPPSRA